MELDTRRVGLPKVRGESVFPVAAFYLWVESRPSIEDWIQPIILIWEDGRVIQSQTPVSSVGLPYITGSVGAERVQQMLSGLEVRGAFDDPIRFWHRRPHDSSHFDIAIAADSRRLHMASWDRNPARVQEPEEDRRFCELWYTLDNALLHLRPAAYRDAGTLDFEYDWLPTPLRHGRQGGTQLPG